MSRNKIFAGFVGAKVAPDAQAELKKWATGFRTPLNVDDKMEFDNLKLISFEEAGEFTRSDYTTMRYAAIFTNEQGYEFRSIYTGKFKFVVGNHYKLSATLKKHTSIKKSGHLYSQITRLKVLTVLSEE